MSNWYNKSHAQVCAVQAEKMNVAYMGVDNPMRIVVSNRDCKDLVVTTNNGNIRKGEGNCDYLYRPAEAGPSQIIVNVKRGNKMELVGTMDYRVKYLPDPTPQVNGRSGGNIKKSIFRAQLLIYARLMNFFEFDTRYVITSFTVSVVRNSQHIFKGKSTGPSINRDVVTAWRSVEVDDVVTIDEIKCKGPDSRTSTLGPVTFHIIAD